MELKAIVLTYNLDTQKIIQVTYTSYPERNPASIMGNGEALKKYINQENTTNFTWFVSQELLDDETVRDYVQYLRMYFNLISSIGYNEQEKQEWQRKIENIHWTERAYKQNNKFNVPVKKLYAEKDKNQILDNLFNKTKESIKEIKQEEIKKELNKIICPSNKNEEEVLIKNLENMIQNYDKQIKELTQKREESLDALTKAKAFVQIKQQYLFQYAQ